ncbi:hypothetical protein D3C80_2146260 [compost metagenome]
MVHVAQAGVEAQVVRQVDERIERDLVFRAVAFGVLRGDIQAVRLVMQLEVDVGVLQLQPPG